MSLKYCIYYLDISQQIYKLSLLIYDSRTYQIYTMFVLLHVPPSGRPVSSSDFLFRPAST